MGSPTHDAAPESSDTPDVEVHADNAVVNTAPDGGGVDNEASEPEASPDTSTEDSTSGSDSAADSGSDSSE